MISEEQILKMTMQLLSSFPYISLFLPSDWFICWGMTYDSDTAKTNYVQSVELTTGDRP